MKFIWIKTNHDCTTFHWSENIWLIEKPWKSVFDFFISKTFHKKTDHEKTIHWQWKDISEITKENVGFDRTSKCLEK